MKHSFTASLCLLLPWQTVFAVDCKGFPSTSRLQRFQIPSNLHVVDRADLSRAASRTAGVVRSVPKNAAIAIKDGIKEQEVQLGMLMLLFYASLGAMLPYMPIIYKDLGLHEQDIGALGAISPIVTLLMAPLWAFFVDRYHIQKGVMISTFVLSVAVKAGFTALPRRSPMITGILVACSSLLAAPTKPLLDAAIMQVLRRKSAYGRARLFGQIGFGLGSYVSGYFVGKDIRYTAAVHALLAVPAAIAMGSMLPSGAAPPPAPRADGSSVAREAELLLSRIRGSRRREMLLFFSAVLAIGAMSGAIENFALSRVAELASKGGVGSNFGFIPLAASLAGAPVFWVSGQLIARLGVPVLLGLSMLSYLLRFLLYSRIASPWQAVPAEMLRGATFASFWAATTYYVYSVAPAGHKATMLGVLNAVYAGLGQSVGSLLGGWLCKTYGFTGAFQRAAAGCGAVLMGYTSLLLSGNATSVAK